MHKLQSLIQTLKDLHLTGEVSSLQKLADYSAPPWLEEWKNCMRYYGFQSFGDTKWHKGKSHLEEPLDEASALQDIHLVEQAHSPDAEGRRISNTALDNFMKEFYGELITQAPRDGWKKKMNHESKRLKA
jgi:hypothetical protein